ALLAAVALANRKLRFPLSLDDARDLCHESFLLLAERHAELAQKEARLLVVLRRGDDGDVHALRLVDLARIDLGKDQVVADAEGVVAAAVERLRRDSAEVAHARESDVD